MLSPVLCAAQNPLVLYCRWQICGLLCHYPVCQPSRDWHRLHSHSWSQYGVSPLSLLPRMHLMSYLLLTYVLFCSYTYMYVSMHRQHSYTDLYYANEALATLSVCLSAQHIVWSSLVWL